MEILLIFLMIPDTTTFNYKQKTTGQTGDNGKKDVQILVRLKHLKFWKTLEMLLINCKIIFF